MYVYKRKEGYTMETYTAQTNTSVATETKIATFFRFTYLWMTIGLIVTAVTSFAVSQNINLMMTLYNFYLLLVIIQIGIVVMMTRALKKATFLTAALYFLVYSFVTGLTLSFIFFAYELGSVFGTFMITAGSFAALSLYGMVTKRDLSAAGNFLYMALWGLIITMIVSFFIPSTALNMTINIIGVLIFAGLTAADTNKLRNLVIANEIDVRDESGRKLALYGALILYLDFINMFLFLLRIFGKRN